MEATVLLSISSFKINKNTVKSFILFIALFIILDHGLAAGLRYLYGKIHYGPGRYNYIINNRFDCLVMGSSTSTCYYSDTISWKTGLSTLNVGLDGSALIYSRCLLDLLVSQNIKPRIILLNIDLFEIQKSAWSGNFYSMVEKLNPFYGATPYITAALHKGKPLEALKFLMASYKYNDLFLSLTLKNLREDKIYKRSKSPETVLQIPVDDKTLETKFSSKINIDKRKKTLFQEFIIECKKNNIHLIFIESPLYYPECKLTERDKKLESIFVEMAHNNNIPFLRITQDTYPVFRSNFLFKDVLHLNDKGSKIFTDILCKEIMQREIPENL